MYILYYIQELDNARCACARFVVTLPLDVCLFLTFVYGCKLSCHPFTNMATMASITFVYLHPWHPGLEEVWDQFQVEEARSHETHVRRGSSTVFCNNSVEWRSPSARCGLLQGFWRVVPVSQDGAWAHECGWDVSEMTLKIRRVYMVLKTPIITDSHIAW